MNADVKERWVAALRSGEYLQGKMCLHSIEDTYCCLGVLCEIAVQDGVIEAPTLPTGFVAWSYGQEENPYGRPDDITNILPKPLLGWSGLELALGDSVTIDGNSTRLAIHNDSGRTFAEIADAIEAQL